MDRRRIVAMAGALALVVGIGAGAVQAADRDVAVSGFSYSPRTVTVNVGDTVTWTNSDAQTHTATSGSAWDTGNIANGQSKSITFRNAGTFGRRPGSWRQLSPGSDSSEVAPRRWTRSPVE